MLYCHKGRGTEGMKDKGSREAPFFLLKISHRNAYRQANIFKVFGFSEGGESKMERFYTKEWHESQQQQICCQNSVLLYMFYPFHLSGKYRFLCGSVQYLYVGISLLDIVRRIRTWSVTLCRIYKLPEIG